MSRKILMLVGDDVEDYQANIVTAPAWPAHSSWIAPFLVVLGTRIEHASLASV